MAQRPNHVPKFGNWDANDQVPFTAVFENARAGKGNGNKIINPNDPSENPAAFGLQSDEPPPARRASQQHYAKEMALGTELTHLKPSGDGGLPRPTMADNSKSGSYGGVRDNEGSFGVGDYQRVDQSPGHPAAYKGRLGNSPSPVWEKKVPPEGGTMYPPANPGRSRLRPGSRGDETPDRGPVLPKFGAWDEKDPASGEGFTVIFNQARNEKKTGGPVRIPALGESPARMDYGNAYKQPQNAPQPRKSSSWVCCFGVQ